VVIGPSRQDALDFAARRSDLLILDGPLRVTHGRSTSVLAVDAEEPWGSGAVFPAGDLRAPPDLLTAVADHVVPVPSGIDLGDLPPRPFGLFTALARPERLVRALGPDVVVSAPDHGPLSARDACKLTHEPGRGAFVPRAATWLATEKCATHLEPLVRQRKISVTILRDTYMACLDREFIRRIVSSIDCERAGREDTRNHDRPKAGW
jgi:tetraacyldisaccharide-1-P 4'-kinase